MSKEKWALKVILIAMVIATILIALVW